MEKLNRCEILSQLDPITQACLGELVILESVDSTNNYLLKLTYLKKVIGCFAEQQTAGKGQRGKSWRSPAGQIYFSILWQFEKNPEQIRGLSLAIGIAVCRALRNHGVQEGLSVKWPNDVYFQSKKLVGILVETERQTEEGCHAIIGIGVNLFLSPKQVGIDQPWASLHEASNTPVSRNIFAGALLNETIIALIQFSKYGFNAFHQEWLRLDYLFNKRITVTSAQQVLTGIMRGVSSQGELLLLDDQHREQICLNGTIKLLS